jgi:hypothetical protein
MRVGGELFSHHVSQIGTPRTSWARGKGEKEKKAHEPR